jgi:hypothetical protein
MSGTNIALVTLFDKQKCLQIIRVIAYNMTEGKRQATNTPRTIANVFTIFICCSRFFRFTF